MTGIIVTGHGHFSTRLLGTITLVAGQPEDTTGVDLPEGCSPSDLKEAMIGSVEALEGGKILALADLVGGTPSNVAAVLKEKLKDRRIRVMAGVNMAELVETAFSRPVYSLGELAAAVLTADKEGIRDLDCLDSEGQEPGFEDGLQRI